MPGYIRLSAEMGAMKVFTCTRLPKLAGTRHSGLITRAAYTIKITIYNAENVYHAVFFPIALDKLAILIVPLVG